MTPVLLAFFGLGLVRAANAEVHRFERLAASEVSSHLSGDEKRVEIHSKVGPEAIFGDVKSVTIVASNFSSDGLPLFTEPWRSRKGILRTLRISMKDFAMRGLGIASLETEIPDCRFDLSLAIKERHFRLSRSGVGTGRVEVTDQALAAFIRQKYRQITRVEVKIDRDKIFVDGEAVLLMIKTPFSVVAKLEPAGGSQLNLTYAKVRFGDKPASPELEQTLLKTLNPVVDLDRDLGLNGAMQVEKLILQNGIMAAIGTTRIPLARQGTTPAQKSL